MHSPKKEENAEILKKNYKKSFFLRSPKKEENAQIKKKFFLRSPKRGAEIYNIKKIIKKSFGSKQPDHLKVKDEIFAGVTSKKKNIIFFIK